MGGGGKLRKGISREATTDKAPITTHHSTGQRQITIMIDHWLFYHLQLFATGPHQPFESSPRAFFTSRQD